MRVVLDCNVVIAARAPRASVERSYQVASIVEPVARSFDLYDPDDEIYLATAVAGRADVLVTGNIRHFPAPRYGPVKILRPADFLVRQRQ